ncbi:MAG: hypothetical protein EOO40_00520 [Deltaproteobacteria bacterium]|nr:MAG: hypothetical protein EOO40_00520 [Deltaproteobacteria bacterium]
MRSPTAPAALSKVKGASFNMDAHLMEDIQADIRFSHLSKITMNLTNATIVELSDIDVIDNVRYRSEGCKRAIKARLAAGYKVTMVQSALMGNVTYFVGWDTSFSGNARARVETLEQLALELGGGVTSVSETTISAQGLVWGINESPFLASLSIPEMDPAQYKPSQHLIGSHVDAAIPPVSDTPVVLADHEQYNEELPIKTPNLPPRTSTVFRQEQPLDGVGSLDDND